MAPRAVVLFSGGLDSTTCVAIAHSMGFEPVLLSFHYGQRHDVALHPNAEMLKKYGVKDVYMTEIHGIGRTSALVDPGAEVPKNKDPRAPGIPPTYVPGRNLVFLSYAAGLADEINAADIFIGCSEIDFSGYPDCRGDFLRTMEVAINRGTRLGQNEWITLHAPLLLLNKAQTIQKGLELGVDYGKTFSCYDPIETADGDDLACATCDACQLRLEGFKQANVQDPIKYLPDLNLLGQSS
jgi:7-cyano-7-deazaguanine synthase